MDAEEDPVMNDEVASGSYQGIKHLYIEDFLVSIIH
jgi:hypothetical protein